jgi:predicted nucleic acid-binding Zn ribbon protein
MPTYEFRCPDGTIIERSFKISEVPEQIPAPDGSGMAVRQISGGGALLFKGSGFYITDYGKDGKKDQRTAGAVAKKPAEGASGGEGAKASETSAAPKSESAPAAPAVTPPKSSGGSSGASGAA